MYPKTFLSLFKGLFSLHWWAIVGFIVLWNAGGALIEYLNGSEADFVSPASSFVAGFLCGLLSLVTFLITCHETIRDFFVCPKRRHLYTPVSFGFISVVLFLLFAGSLINAFVLLSNQ